MKIKDKILKEALELRKGVTFNATKVSPKLKKRKIKVTFPFKEKFIIGETINLTLTEVRKKIKEQIEIQKKFLTGDFEHDKAIKWRIKGFEVLLKELK